MQAAALWSIAKVVKFIPHIDVSQTHAIDASQLGRPLRQDVVMVWPTENAELTQETPSRRCGQSA